jgi:transposase-like protein
MTDQIEKRPVGRPSQYDPAYCERIIELGRLGKSIEQIAAQIGVGTKTIYNWRDEFPEFLRALEMAKELELDWWENIAQNMMVENKDGSKLNSAIWSRSMAARFPKKYRESTKTEITGENGAPLLQGIQVTFVKPNE